MKNIIGLIITLILFTGICIAGYYINHNANDNYQELTISALEEKIAVHDTFTLFIEQSKFQSSQNFNDILRLISEQNNIEIFYIDITGLTNSEFSRLFNIVSFDSAPTLAYINQGVETDPKNRVVGYKDDESTRETILTSLNQNNIIK